MSTNRHKPRHKLKPSLLRENNKEIVDKYVCPKCDSILWEAVQTSCGHWLCNGCAEELIHKKEDTPFCLRTDCNEELTIEDGQPFFPDRFVRKEINHFAIMCPNRKFGCSWEGKIIQLFEHLEACDHEKQECPHCNGAYSPTEYQSHVDSCPKAIVSCPLKDHGCKEESEMSREECLNHLTSKQGIFHHMLMMATALSSFVTTSTSSIDVDGNPVECDSGRHNGKLHPASPSPFDGPNDFEFGFLPDDYVSRGRERMGSNMLITFVVSKITDIQAEMTKKESMIHTLQDKVAHLESTLSIKQNENEDRDFRLSLMENSNFDGSVVWKIPQFSQRMDDARTGKYTFILSLPFYSSRYGYKMCLRLYILGDGIGKGTHMSLFFVVMKGEFDNILQWPFTHKVTFKLINQCGSRDIMDIFQPDPLSSSFQKPKSDMNIASGCPRFISMNNLLRGGFIVDDTIFIKVKVDIATIRHP